MFGKNKPDSTKPLSDSKESQQDKIALQQLETEIKECQEVIDDFFRPLKDLRVQIASSKNDIDFMSKNFDSHELAGKKTRLVELQAQEKPVEETCKTALKKSNLLDKFAALNERRMQLLTKDTSASHYQPPTFKAPKSK